MSAILLALSGPYRGTTFKLTKDELSIGRDPSNGLCLNDFSTSRRHCMIKKEADSFAIIDLDSRNGTFVNDIPAKQRKLEHTDQILIGNSLFVFLLPEQKMAPPETRFDEDVWIAKSTMELHLKDAIYLDPDRIATVLPSTARAAHDLNILLKVSTDLNSIRDLKSLKQKILEYLFQVIPAKRGAIVLVTENQEEFDSFCLTAENNEQSDFFSVSRTILRRVLSDRIALFSNDVQANEKIASAQSLVTAKVTSLLAVPLLFRENLLGILYLDKDSDVPFNEHHLQLATAIASTAAVCLENVQHLDWLQQKSRSLQVALNMEGEMIGEGARMREVYELIERVAPTDSTVLIRGETGTGKELVARSIHRVSARSDKPFVVLNCAALPETLLESELFGYEKGAFTGAVGQKKGKLEVANGGTAFLDEVAEISPLLQTKLLRVLQEREFERIGGTRPIKIDVRFIAATNRDLEEAIKTGQFRSDFFYRLNVVSITVPPLRDRAEDIPLLTTYFAAKYSKKCKRALMGVSSEARACLARYDWPGNVRELENVIERALVLSRADAILPEDLPDLVVEMHSQVGTAPMNYHAAVREAKKEIISRAMEQAQGDYREAAKLLGIHHNNLYRLIRTLNLK